MYYFKRNKHYKRIKTRKNIHKNVDNKLLRKIPLLLFYIISLIIIIMIYLNKENKIKELKKEINHLKLEFKNGKVIENKNENQEMIEIISNYRNEINLEYNKLNENNNYNITQSIKNFIDKLDEFLASKSKLNYIENKIEYPISIYNSNSTLKNQFFTRFENVFGKYINETELSDEYKNKFKQDILNGYSKLFNRNYTKIDIIIYNKKFNLGNALFVINNLIYYCELLGCKKIYLSKEYCFRY